MPTKKPRARASTASQSAVAQALITRIEAIDAAVPQVTGPALTPRQLVPLLTIGQQYMDATATALGNVPGLRAATKVDPDKVREAVRRATAFEGVLTSCEALTAAVRAVVEIGWAGAVQQCDRVVKMATAMIDNEEEPKAKKKIAQQLASMKKARKIRRKQEKPRGRGKRPAANAKAKPANGAPPAAAKVTRTSEKSVEKSTETQAP